MATITEAKLKITHDHSKKTGHAIVTCEIKFTGLELCMMKQCPEENLFVLKCQLWGEDSFLTGADDFLYTYDTVHRFPDGSPTAVESRKFEVVVGESLLDEDWGTDEVYGKLLLRNMFTMVQITRNTNTVSHSF